MKNTHEGPLWKVMAGPVFPEVKLASALSPKYSQFVDVKLNVAPTPVPAVLFNV